MAIFLSFFLFYITFEKNTTNLPSQQVFLSCTLLFCSVLILPSPRHITFPINVNLRWPSLCLPFKAMYGSSFVAFNLLINLIFDHTSLFYHLPSATFICSLDVTYALANSFPKVKLPVVGHFSCSRFELNHIENHSLSLPTPSMNAVFSYELYRCNLFLGSFIFLWSYFFHILTSKVSSNLSKICFLWASSNIFSLEVYFASASGTARRNLVNFIHQSHYLQCFQYLIP